MSDNEILKILRAKNPFISSASPNPWDNINPDLQQLNRPASEEIEQLMRQKRRQPTLPLAGLILGEAGSGKTHMLMRILRKLRSTGGQAIFVAVKTFRDPGSVTQHLLSEIFISLRRIHSKGRTQFDIIASEVMAVYKERRQNDGFNDTAKLDPKTYLARDIPNLDRNFLKCLLLYIGTSDEGVRDDILDWLCDGLDDNDALRLGLPLKDTNSMSDARREQEAEKVLISLGLVLAYAKIPMIICFDQLDAMKDKALITAWGNIIALIMNDLSGILPLCFLRSQIWNDIFSPGLDEAISQRLSNNIIRMDDCSVEQAKQLVYKRINYVFERKEKPEEIYNWLISHMNITSSMSPRSIIQLANNTINNPPEITATTTTPATPEPPQNNDFEAIRAVYDEECRDVRAEPNNWPPNYRHLMLALEVWLKSHDGVELQKSTSKNIHIAGKYNGVECAFIVTTSKSHFVATAGLKDGIKFLEKNPGAFCFYISEDRIHKKTWKQANEFLKQFQTAGGRAELLNQNTRANWYGLTSLINRIDNGDVNLSGNRPASRDDAKIFVKSIPLLEMPFTPATQPAPTATPATPPTPEPPKPPVQPVTPTTPATPINPELQRELKKIVNSSPMQIIPVGRAIDFLAQRNIFVDKEKLLAFVMENNKLFKIFQSQNDTLIAIL